MDSTAWGSFGGSPGGGLGGSAPPEIERFWPSCAHSACFLGPTRPSPPHRATASPMTDLAPASPSTLAHASRVAQVVSTSSTSKTRSLSTSPPGRVAKMPRIASPAFPLSLRVKRYWNHHLGTRPLRAAVTSLASEGLRPGTWQTFRPRQAARTAGTPQENTLTKASTASAGQPHPLP